MNKLRKVGELIMKIYKCTEKKRDSHGKIISYTLLNASGEYRSVSPDDLKKAIHEGRVSVSNLTLTSDNRLVDKKSCDNDLVMQQEQDAVALALMEMVSVEMHAEGLLRSKLSDAVRSGDKEQIDEIKERIENLKYTVRHRYAFQRVEKKLLGRNTMRGVLHDIDKVFMYITMNKKDAHNIHRATSSHHEANARTHDDFVEMVIDWECARLTKPDKPLNARQTLEKFYPHLKNKIEPILNELGL